MKLKNLLANKNVVTILGVILIVVVLYAFYNWRVNEAINPIHVPYAKVTIGPRTEITPEMIDYVDIQQISIKGNVLTNVNNPDQPKKIIGRYTNVNCTIPAGSLFYDEALVLFEELPDSFLIDMPEGMVAYNFNVTTMSTYGNSIYPGNYVDVYFKGVEENDKIILGKLVSNVKTLAVKDSSGQHVFENTQENREPSQIIFAVTEEMSELLRTAEYINNAELILVPTNVGYKADSDKIVTEFSSDDIRTYIENKRA